MTLTTPSRLIIWHFLHRLLTEDVTFISVRRLSLLIRVEYYKLPGLIYQG